eukprot:746229-Hanusia_phi.AAC.6
MHTVGTTSASSGDCRRVSSQHFKLMLPQSAGSDRLQRARGVVPHERRARLTSRAPLYSSRHLTPPDLSSGPT